MNVLSMEKKIAVISALTEGKRNAENAYYLMHDLEARLTTRVQLTSDGFRPYVNAVEDSLVRT